MIKVKQNGDNVRVSFFTNAILIHEFQFEEFVDNLFILSKDSKKKVGINDLRITDFNLIFHKHVPNYATENVSTINIQYLLDNFKWSSTRLEYR